MRRAMYRALAWSNDARAVRRGPRAVVRRVIRRRALRSSRTLIERVLRALIP